MFHEILLISFENWPWRAYYRKAYLTSYLQFYLREYIHGSEKIMIKTSHLSWFYSRLTDKA